MAGAILLLAALALLELTVRVAVFPEWRALSHVGFVRHPVFGHMTQPNAALRQISPPDWDVINHTNSRGFRDRETGFVDDLRGLWMAGDSNTFARGVADDQTFASRLQARGYANANLAVEGHSIVAQTKVLQSLASEGYRPRAVVLVMSLNNAIQDRRPDIETFEAPPVREGSAPVDTLTARGLLLEKLGELDAAREASLESIKTRLIRNSALYCWLKTALGRFPALRAMAIRSGLKADVDFVHAGPLDLLSPQQPNASDILISSTAEYLAKLNHWVRRDLGVPFGVVLLPSHHHLYPVRFARYVDRFGYAGLGLDPRRPLRELEAGLKSRGVTVLDPTFALESASDPQLIFLEDAHYNAKAHGVLTEAIMAWLQSELGIAPQP